MKTINAFNACESYGFRYAIIITKNGMESVHGLYSSKRATRRIANRLADEYGNTATVEVAQLVKE